jgi:hypothetical protein
MTEAEWFECREPQKMLDWLQSSGRASDRRLRLFAVACCRRLWHILKRRKSREAVEIAEQYAEGKVGDKELAVGRKKASNAVGALNRSAWLYEAAILDLARAVDSVCCQPAADVAHAVAKQTADSYGPTGARVRERAAQAEILRCTIPNPFQAPAALSPGWLAWGGGTVKRLAEAAYEERQLPSGTLDGARLAVLADALEEADCSQPDLLDHLRGPGPHVRGCWPVDLLLGKQ